MLRSPVYFFTAVSMLSILLSFPAQPVYADWLFGPDNFEECIEEYLPRAETDSAARVIHAACDKKFRKKQNTEQAECWLEHVVDTRSDVAVRAIATACSNLYVNNKKTDWSNCVLKKLPGVKVDAAARSIGATCRT